MVSQILVFVLAAATSFLLTYPLIFLLRSFNVGQPIREEGPSSHQSKAGTPTMGGMGIILTLIIFGLIFFDFEINGKYLAFLLLILGFAGLGLADDFCKVFYKRNLGLSFWQKIIIQILIAGAFSLFLVYSGHNTTVAGFLRNWGFLSPMRYALFSTFLIVGTANAANLTDGLNGLLAGTAGIAFLAFSVLSVKLGYFPAATFCSAAAGAVLIFLYFNFPKAKVFMGDVASLALGAALAGIAILIHKELRLAIIGLVFMIEALSVILQVTSYKIWKERIFRMAPLHHHFELMGWGEVKVVVAFWLAALVCGIIGVII
ncbi:MAG: phospho-N-acetylmuramoyl-pentapeptide-transferase [Candidatus Margulisbacteria bacterium]|nr:phospho-N-acetylmuramoyl-pentapeptide-transferase [Candidatus Margulisiibacteriota bacterium]